MCGRIIVSKTNSEIKDFIYDNYNKANFSQQTMLPNYNLAPGTEVISIIYTNGLYRSGLINWGLKFDFIKSAVINIREESLKSKSYFKKLYAKNRCLILADGFYEWDELTKQVYRIHLENNSIFALAAIWHKSCDNKFHCGIITTKANKLMEPIHSRMPLILDTSESKEFLQESNVEKSMLLASREIIGLRKHLVTALVNKPSFNNEECIKELELPINKK